MARQVEPDHSRTRKASLGERFEQFLVVLEDTGDVGEACIATKLSVNAVTHKKRKDPEFQAAWEMALERSGAGKKYLVFLDVYSKTANMSESLRLSGLKRADVLTRQRDDPAFAEVFHEAKEEGIDALEAEARLRAHKGRPEPVFHSGQVVYERDAKGNIVVDELGQPVPFTINKYSDRLLELLLKANRPDKYRENVKVDHAVTGGVLLLSAKAPTEDQWEERMARKRLAQQGKVIEHEA